MMNKLAYWAIRFGGMTSVRLVWLWVHIRNKTHYSVSLNSTVTNKAVPIVYASNHQTMLDSPAVFTAVSLLQLYKMAPVKFMTWHKYYNTKYKPLMWLTGCYSSHGEGFVGVDGAIEYARQKYGIFIFPEGKRTRPESRNPAYSGISKILEQLPDARLILVHLDWEPRKSFFHRPILSVVMSEADQNLDRSNPDAIMDAVYKL